jgi:hypothetical protein
LRSFIIAQLTRKVNAFAKYAELNQTIFTIDIAPEAILDIDAAYNKQEGLSLSPEVEYLDNLAVKIGRKLTDSEIFGFSSQFRALPSQDFQRKICY